jgi:uncharacterized phage protein (TIGR02220 family)
MIVYQVKDWDRNYENNKSREREDCSFVCVPNSHSGLGISRVLDEKDGATIYGIFNLIVGACSRQRKPREGWMTQDGHPTGTPWAVADLSLMFRRPEKEIRRALDVLCSPGVAWIGRVEIAEDGQIIGGARVVPADCPPSALEGRKERKKEEKEDSPPPFYAESRILLHWLNEKSGSHFREVDANLSLIAARLKSTSGDVEGMKQMVTRQCALWKGDPKMDTYLQPSTLFGAQNFEKYYGARNKAAVTPSGQPALIRQPRRNESDFIDPNLANSPV